MADSQNFLWLVLVGVIVITLTIVLIFILINVCISKQAAKRRAQISKTKQTNSSDEKNDLFTAHIDDEKPPPLPSRDQFLDADSRSHSYEEMDACVEPVKAEVQTSAPPQPAFIQHCETQPDLEDGKSVSESYDDVEQLDQDVGQSYEDVASLPDYVELEEEPPALQQEPEFHNAQTDSRESLASYDDIDVIDVASEDYDDVG
ncbi:uncharacterized protein LOC118814302 [Colossoma macropomum]|uniref:uncharacterized protein LOC118814302 n=1 Tax=Colossoma macropomum TaxID=42526 RepID=UPI00186439DB|nr:uncharacterized protein LOC118814302 [Colossoma macropomum]XP_036435731.1 uncharacterized protein LOC118814302 [Colossoma macropomum]